MHREALQLRAAAAARAHRARWPRFAREWRDAADARLHAFPARAAHDRRQARHALDPGPAARPRGARAPARDAALPRREGHDRHAGELPRAVRRRPREGATSSNRSSPQKMGFDAAYPVTGQTYTRKTRLRRSSPRSRASRRAPSKFGNDLRLLAAPAARSRSRSRRSRSAPRRWRTSAIRCARSGSRARAVRHHALDRPDAHARRRSGFERTLDDSREPPARHPRGVPRRGCDPALMHNVAAGSWCTRRSSAGAWRRSCRSWRRRSSCAGRAAGGDRQALHERIRRTASTAAAADEGRRGANDLARAARGRPDVPAHADEIETALDPARHVGRAPEQVDAFLAEVVEPAARAVRRERADAGPRVCGV